MILDPDRAAQWVQSGEQWFDNMDPFILLNIQMLGHAEPPILALETELAKSSNGESSSIGHALLLTQCSALSMYWIFGLYEVLRMLKDCVADRFAVLDSLFHDVAVIRMPLAKHEVKGSPGYRKTWHYPTSIWEPNTGKVGWHVFDPQKETMVALTRSQIADRFLSISE